MHPKNVLSTYYVQDPFVDAGDSVVSRKPTGEGARPTLDLSKSLPRPEGSPTSRLRAFLPHRTHNPAQGRAVRGQGGHSSQTVWLQKPEPSPQQALPSLTVPSLQPTSGGLCVSSGAGRWRVLVGAHTGGESPACLIFVTFSPTRRAFRVFLADPLSPRAP